MRVHTVQRRGVCLPRVSPSSPAVGVSVAQSHPSSSHRGGWQRPPGAFHVSEESVKSCLWDGAGLSSSVRPSHATRVDRQTLSPPCKGAFQSSRALGGDTVLVVPLGQGSPCSYSGAGCPCRSAAAPCAAAHGQGPVSLTRLYFELPALIFPALWDVIKLVS